MLILLSAILRFLAFPFLMLYVLWRGYRDPRYLRRIAERFGALPRSFRRTAPNSVWLHAVSVGEVLSSIELIRALRRNLPHTPIFVSTSTLAGRGIADQTLALLADGIFYAPLDYGFAVRRVLRRLRPSALVILETEIWPNWYREARRAGCALLVLNGRISDRAFPRYRRLRWFFAPVLSLADAIYVQSERDRVRYIAAGAPPERVSLLGNLKYDTAEAVSQPPEAVVGLLDRIRPSAVWIAASTMPPASVSDVDEDDVVLAAFLRIAKAGLLLILVPRRPERFEAAASKLAGAGIPFVRRSELNPTSRLELPGALLLDSMGELNSIFSRADVVFLGGTLAERGGHNLLEPAAAGRAVVIGPHMENFAAIADEFRRAGAVVEIGSADELPATILRLLSDAGVRDDIGKRAEAAAAARKGVAAKAAAIVSDALDEATPHWSAPSAVSELWLKFLSRFWLFAVTRLPPEPRRLPKPVISIGGLGVGGAGKTPLALWLAGRLRKNGSDPCILTRGYRRRSIEDSIIVPRGASAPAYLTGDEAQLFIASETAHVGIGADRFATASVALAHCDPNAFLLDDGFQHRRLHRDLDLVLLDALNPFGNRAVLPLGRLREPIQALERATAVLITRAQPGRSYAGIRRIIRQHNADAPIHRARVLPLGWYGFPGSEPTALKPVRAAAFCGLGNPDSFWETLRTLGIEPVAAWTFGDHHRYKPRDLRRMAGLALRAGAEVLLTTEKDSINLPAATEPVIAPLRIYWLRIGLEIEQEEELLAQIRAKLQRE